MVPAVEAERGQSKVYELARGVRPVEKCVVRLDIAVQDAVRVEEAQPARELHGEANLLYLGRRLLSRRLLSRRLLSRSHRQRGEDDWAVPTASRPALSRQSSGVIGDGVGREAR